MLRVEVAVAVLCYAWAGSLRWCFPLVPNFILVDLWMVSYNLTKAALVSAD